jgi:hypothetical protein
MQTARVAKGAAAAPTAKLGSQKAVMARPVQQKARKAAQKQARSTAARTLAAVATAPFSTPTTTATTPSAAKPMDVVSERGANCQNRFSGNMLFAAIRPGRTIAR